MRPLTYSAKAGVTSSRCGSPRKAPRRIACSKTCSRKATTIASGSRDAPHQREAPVSPFHTRMKGPRAARALGSKSVLMMSNHGALVVGETVPQAFERLYFLERASQAQVLALSTGRALRLRSVTSIAKATARSCCGPCGM